MSYAGYKLIHAPTAVDFCATAYLTHSPSPLTSLDREPVGESSERVGDFNVVVDASKTSSNHSSAPDVSVSDPPNPTDSTALPPELVEPDDMALLTSSPEVVSTPWRVDSKRTVPPNLIIAKAHVLEVYYLRTDCPPQGKDSSAGGAAGGSKSRLELACDYRLHGTIESLASLRHCRDEGLHGRDAILLTFKEAKVSVLYFDDETHSLQCSSLHYYEGPEWNYLKRGREKFARGPLVRADPAGRCAGVLLFDNQLMLLKAAQSYAVDLGAMGYGKIVDFVFLAGFNEPVVALLEEKEGSWVGRPEGNKLPQLLTCLTLNLNLRHHPPLFSHADLPYDGHSLVPVPGPLGGVLLLGASSIFYCSGSDRCGLALSPRDAWGEAVLGLPRVRADLEGLELDCAHVAWVAADVAVVAAKTGALLFLTLLSDGSGSVRQLALESSIGASLPSCLVSLGPHHLFLGSRVGNSLLVSMQGGVGREAAGGAEPPFKRAKREEEEEEKELRPVLEDTLLNTGPIRDMVLGPNTVLCCSGHGKTGSLTWLHRSVPAEVVTEEALEGCMGVWTVHGGGGGRAPRPHAALLPLLHPPVRHGRRSGAGEWERLLDGLRDVGGRQPVWEAPHRAGGGGGGTAAGGHLPRTTPANGGGGGGGGGGGWGRPGGGPLCAAHHDRWHAETGGGR